MKDLGIFGGFGWIVIGGRFAYIFELGDGGWKGQSWYPDWYGCRLEISTWAYFTTGKTDRRSVRSGVWFRDKVMSVGIGDQCEDGHIVLILFRPSPFDPRWG
jgi:hypothetical protein